MVKFRADGLIGFGLSEANVKKLKEGKVELFYRSTFEVIDIPLEEVTEKIMESVKKKD